MPIYIKRSCVACSKGYRVWCWEPPLARLHICCARCRAALDKGYELGMRAANPMVRMRI